VTQHFRYYVADVFTSIPYTGNPLAVVPDARGLTTEAMTKIAREFNLSETVFVLPPRDRHHTRAVRIFTPARELPFAGHPTIGTAIVLATAGYVTSSTIDGDIEIVLEEGVGPVPVRVRMMNGMPDFAKLTAKHPQVVGGTPPDRAVVAAMLSLASKDIVAGPRQIETWSCGVPYLFVPVVNREAVGRARPLGDLDGHAVFVFAHSGSDIHARMFAPELGVVEDPATGSAAAALGGYLAARDARQDGTLTWAISQGVEMGRPSLIELEVDREGGQVTAVRVGGRAVVVSEGSILAM
jgi:trans-2,3-dihydro-3-hydroxyanthranilate isomerase